MKTTKTQQFVLGNGVRKTPESKTNGTNAFVDCYQVRSFMVVLQIVLRGFPCAKLFFLKQGQLCCFCVWASKKAVERSGSHEEEAESCSMSTEKLFLKVGNVAFSMVTDSQIRDDKGAPNFLQRFLKVSIF